MAEVKIRNKRFSYRDSIKWQAERKGVLSSPDKPDIGIATPPEFKGHPGMWTPEDLLVASVNSCIMTTFLYYAEKKGVKFLTYESQGEGILESVESKFMFSEITIKPRISVREEDDVQKAKDLIALSESHCLISNSIRSKVEVIAEVKVEG